MSTGDCASKRVYLAKRVQRNLDVARRVDEYGRIMLRSITMSYYESTSTEQLTYRRDDRYDYIRRSDHGNRQSLA
jgi:hypothetical protein